MDANNIYTELINSQISKYKFTFTFNVTFYQWLIITVNSILSTHPIFDESSLDSTKFQPSHGHLSFFFFSSIAHSLFHSLKSLGTRSERINMSNMSIPKHNISNSFLSLFVQEPLKTLLNRSTGDFSRFTRNSFIA